MIYNKKSPEVYNLLKRDNRIMITGSRNYNDYKQFEQLVLEHINKTNIKNNELVFIAGGAHTGADKHIETLCNNHPELHIVVYPAVWEVNGKFNKAAGFVRNEEMVKACTQTLAFWDKQSKGTKHAIDISRENDIRTKVFIIKVNQ